MKITRTLAKALLCCLFILLLPAQESNRDLDESVETVLFGNVWEGHRTKQFARGGDATAVSLTKILGGRPLSDAEMATALDILEASFSNITWVRIPEDKTPRTTLFVLAAFDVVTKDASLRGRIRTVKKQIENEAGVKVP